MKTSWGGVASWYDKIVNDPDSYQARVILPNILRMLSPKKGERVLDLACGQGFFSHALSAEGASVVGVDIAPELIEIAREHALHNQEFYVSSADNLRVLRNGSFDSALCVLAIQNIEKMALAMKEVSRVLKPGAKFVLVINHPAFRVPGKSFWGFDDKSTTQYRRVDEYMSESRAAIDMNPGLSEHFRAGKEVTYSFHRPLQVYSKNLFNAGFVIARIEEWVSHKSSERGPKAQAENKARKEIPLFMCLECVKM